MISGRHTLPAPHSTDMRLASVVASLMSLETRPFSCTRARCIDSPRPPSTLRCESVSETPTLTQARHRECLANCLAALERFHGVWVGVRAPACGDGPSKC